MKLLSRFTVLFAVVLIAGSMFAQTTANLTGTVTSGGNPLPGVSVTISSPSLQGTRTAVTGEAGGYSFAALPPGDYTVAFDLSGMEKVTKRQTLQLSQTSRVDADLKVSGVTEAITVTASAPSVLETPQVASNYTLKEVERLPVARNQLATALLAPGVNGNTLSASQLQISGSPGYDNLVLVNGVVVSENIRSQMRPLYIEDAIQETTVLTGSISAEYGRFTGGVVNTITKSGGNEFSGSLRDSLTNPLWSAQTPAKETRLDKLNNVYEGTLGGYVMKDRLWFFGAGRMAKTDTALTTATVPANNSAPATPVSPAISYNQNTDEKRYEVKLTGQITPKHSIVGSYFKIDSKSQNTRFTSLIYDLASLTPRQDPESLTSVHYNGVLTSNLLLEGQYSKREQAFEKNGAQFTDLVKGTLLLDRNNGNARFNSPTFCGVCDTETRNNNEYLVKTNYFLNTKGIGSHNLVAGIDRFEEQRYANNHQSGSDFRIFVSAVKYSGGKLYPVITPTTSSGGGTYIRWTPIFVNANESNLRTDSAFANDKWDFNSHFTFNIGVRYDKNHAQDGNGVVTSDDNKFSPRLSAHYDIKGDGRQRINVSYAEYVSRIVEGIASSNASAGNPATIDFAYKGPAINNGVLDTSIADAITAVFNYFNTTQGGTANTATTNLRPSGGRSVPGYSSYFNGTLASPYNNEWTVGYGAQIGATGYAKVDVVSRDWKNFYATQVNTGTKHITTPLGIPVDLGLITNTDAIDRTYRGVQLQGRWNPSRFQMGLNYTWSKLRGNDEGETAGSGPVSNVDTATYYPEFLNYANYHPVGYLSGDQRHRARAWVGYDLPLPEVIGRVNVSLLQNYDSGTAYSAVTTIDAAGYTGAPSRTALGYNQTPLGQYYFGGRGIYRTDDQTATNLAVRYSRSIFHGIEVFAQGDLLNAFNEDAIVSSANINTTVRTSASGTPRDFVTGNTLTAFNPFTTTPVAGVNYSISPAFGTALNSAAYQTPRTYRVSFGLRF